MLRRVDNGSAAGLQWAMIAAEPLMTEPKRVEKTLCVAIDGPAGAGKSTVARAVAEKLGVTYIDTGAMYRAVALWALRLGVDLNDLHRLEQLAKEAQIELAAGQKVFLNNEDVTQAIRAPEVSASASKVAACGGVRRAMQRLQRGMASTQSVVMEGRDIGTVVFPDARVKVYLDADPGERARRRAEETGARPSAVAHDMAERDQRDRTRPDAPLTQAPDAEYLDSTGLTLEQVEEAILRLVRKRISN